VFPRLRSDPHERLGDHRVLSSGSPEMDRLLGGGLQAGTSLLITGPAGTGKSVLAAQYACAAVARGERVRFFIFDERLSTFRLRGQGLGARPRGAHRRRHALPAAGGAHRALPRRVRASR
jgi:circadian clock protein KaiC